MLPAAAQFARRSLWVMIVCVALTPFSTRSARSGVKPTAKGPSTIAEVWHDSLRDGFPDAVRIDSPEDRATFVRWLTFLAESQFYKPGNPASEIQDCAGLIRFAFRNALMAHNAAWHQAMNVSTAGLNDEDFGDLQRFTYPNWILGTGLFRMRPGPFAADDVVDGAFSQFADAATLLRYNVFPVSRDIRSAQAGDILFYYQPAQSEPYHSMLFVGRSYYRPQGRDWVVYHTGDLGGGRGEVREVEAKVLMNHPDPRWRPLAGNPRFLGVYRFELLR